VVIASYSDGAWGRLTAWSKDEAWVKPSHQNGHGIWKTRCIWRFGRWNTGSRPPGKAAAHVKAELLISEADNSWRRLMRSAKRKRRADNFLKWNQSLSPGDSGRACGSRRWPVSGDGVVTAARCAHDACCWIRRKLYVFCPLKYWTAVRGMADEGLLDSLAAVRANPSQASRNASARLATQLIRIAANVRCAKPPWWIRRQNVGAFSCTLPMPKPISA